MEIKIISVLFILTTSVLLGRESELTVTYQPLNGLGSGSIFVSPVTCHQWYASSVAGPVSFISAKNIPPTDNPERANFDINLASATGLNFSTSDLGAPDAPLTMTLDASQFDIGNSGWDKTEILRASLECLHRCTAEGRLSTVKLAVKLPEKDAQWIEKIVDEFNNHDRSKPFFKSDS
ncbi:MAG: hypothetical protein ACON5H_02440 [Akkermansiaceae bacterium]